jgi:hypothetical protein
LAMSPRPARHRPDEKSRIGIAFDDYVERPHVLPAQSSQVLVDKGSKKQSRQIMSTWRRTRRRAFWHSSQRPVTISL